MFHNRERLVKVLGIILAVMLILMFSLAGIPPTVGFYAKLAVLTAVAILEWPVLLSRGRFDLLWLTVILRTAVMVLLAVNAWRAARIAAPAVDEARS